MLRDMSIINQLSLNVNQLARFLSSVKETYDYRMNTYHNWNFAFRTCRNAFCFYKQFNLEDYLEYTKIKK